MATVWVECEDCEGTGSIEKVCNECGHTYEENCERCGGAGEVEEEDDRDEEEPKE